MSAFTLRRVTANILTACVVTIILVALAVLVPIVVWLQPDDDTKEITSG